MKYYLAIDIGASSGRHILAHLEDGRIVLEEVHRFKNGMVHKDGHLVWSVDRLFEEILTGMKKCKELGKIPYSMGIDTWAVDYALLDENDQLLGDVYGYRDERVNGMDEEVYKYISESELYKRTGIQKQPFNTIYQLMAHKKLASKDFARAKKMLLVPDYFHYLLSGQKVTEYTNASTTQLISPVTKKWDYELIDLLGYPREIFGEIRNPGEEIGVLTDKIQEYVGFNCKVVLPPTHDTASAVMAVPSYESENVLYISSGTWSLMGTELMEANCSQESKEANLTNEGGYDYRFRFLKNIMGMWMINSVKEEIAPDISFSDLCEMAANESITSIVNVNDKCFLAPESMVTAVKNYCANSEQQVPEGIAQIANVIYRSLAKCYADTAKEIERIVNKDFDEVYIVGGGANASYLNALTAKACAKPVFAGPIEATALGNIAAQMIYAKELEDLKSARKCIYNSFSIRSFEVD